MSNIKIYGEHEPKTLAQMQRCMSVGSAVKGVLCADGHLGYAHPIGGVVAYEEDISISGVGFDIACGNMAVRLDARYTDIAPRAKTILQFSSTGGPIAGHFEYNADGAGVSFGTHICDVEVDPETGAVKVVRYTVVQDAGKAVHPSYVEGQMQGGAVQGIGWALNEEYVYGTDGRLQNPGFLDYRIPVASDVPMIDAVIVETPNPGHPYGVRGVGETPIVPPLAAVANAIAAATGTRVNHVPMSPPRVLQAILELTKGKGEKAGDRPSYDALCRVCGAGCHVFWRHNLRRRYNDGEGTAPRRRISAGRAVSHDYVARDHVDLAAWVGDSEGAGRAIVSQRASGPLWGRALAYLIHSPPHQTGDHTCRIGGLGGQRLFRPFDACRGRPRHVRHRLRRAGDYAGRRLEIS